jgi:hypothetical protein
MMCIYGHEICIDSKIEDIVVKQIGGSKWGKYLWGESPLPVRERDLD